MSFRHKSTDLRVRAFFRLNFNANKMSISNQVLLAINVVLVFVLVCGALAAAHLYVKCVNKHAELKAQWENNKKYLEDRYHRKQLWAQQARLAENILSLTKDQFDAGQFLVLKDAVDSLNNASLEQ